MKCTENPCTLCCAPLLPPPWEWLCKAELLMQVWEAHVSEYTKNLGTTWSRGCNSWSCGKVQSDNFSCFITPCLPIYLLKVSPHHPDAPQISREHLSRDTCSPPWVMQCYLSDGCPPVEYLVYLLRPGFAVAEVEPNMYSWETTSRHIITVSWCDILHNKSFSWTKWWTVPDGRKPLQSCQNALERNTILSQRGFSDSPRCQLKDMHSLLQQCHGAEHCNQEWCVNAQLLVTSCIHLWPNFYLTLRCIHSPGLLWGQPSRPRTIIAPLCVSLAGSCWCSLGTRVFKRIHHMQQYLTWPLPPQVFHNLLSQSHYSALSSLLTYNFRVI